MEFGLIIDLVIVFIGGYIIGSQKKGANCGS